METVQRLAASDIRDTAGFQLPEAAENAYLFLFLKSLSVTPDCLLRILGKLRGGGQRERERKGADERRGTFPLI